MRGGGGLMGMYMIFLSFYIVIHFCHINAMQISDQLFEFCVEIKFIQEEGLISFPDLLV